MSGLGFSAASWLAARGAGHLLLLGRHVPEDAAALARLHSLEALGSRVTLVACDVSDAHTLAEVIAKYKHGSHPLRGVIHSAGVLQDGLLARQSASSFHAVMRAKVGGAWLLHELTRELPLQLFVLYSSLASLMGSAAQANYVAANAFLDTLAQHRRRCGLPALSINWGPFADVGRVMDKQLRGLRGLTEREGHALLDEFAASDAAQRAGVGLNLPELLDFYPHLARWPYLTELALVAPPTAAGDPQLLAALRSGDRVQRSAKMRDYLRRELSRVLRMDPERIDDQAPLNRLGLDSLMGLELRRRLEAGLGVALQATLVWTYPTLSAVAEHLVELVDEAPARELSVEEPAPARTDEERASDLAALSDEQLWKLTSSLVG
jgi:acyl carrier protein